MNENIGITRNVFLLGLTILTYFSFWELAIIDSRCSEDKVVLLPGFLFVVPQVQFALELRWRNSLAGEIVLQATIT